MSDFIRNVMQVVEFDVEYCSLSFGVGACTATGSTKCYNFYKGCPVKDVFASTKKVMRYSDNIDHGIYDTIIYPALASVSTNASKITLGSVDDRLGSLGKRSRIQVVLNDFPDTDLYLDKYVGERSYNALETGTHFGKLSARWPYYYGRNLRIKTGKVGDALADMDTRHYIITEWSGPDADGRVMITAQDPLRLADADLSQAPIASSGTLSADITADVGQTFDVSDGTEYDASGYASIGSEIVTFTRSGNTITLTGRGIDGTDAATHSAGDAFQQSIRYEDEAIYDVVYDLMVNYAGVDPSFITLADWASEIDRWFANLRVTRTISKPKSVASLLGELAEFGFLFWWDEIAQQMRLRLNRPLDFDEVVNDIEESANLLEKTVSVTKLDNQRITQVWVYHGVVSYGDSLEDEDNYSKLTIAADLDAEGEQEYNQKVVKKIFIPWLGSGGNEGVASTVAVRLRNRYRDTPNEISFQADFKDKYITELADVISVTTRNLQAESGEYLPEKMRVTSVQEVAPNHRLKVTAETYSLDGRYGFITGNSRPDYDGSTDLQRDKGTYIVDGTTLLFSDGSGPYIIF